MLYFFIICIISTIITAIGLILKARVAPRFLLPTAIVLWVILLFWVLLSHIGLLLIVVGYIIFTIIYGHYRYYKLKYVELDYETDKLKQDYRVVFLTDLQFDVRSDKINYRALEQMIEKTNDIDKDIILLGGDYINYSCNVSNVLDYLSKLDEPQYGMYAVIGNHDYVNYEAIVDKFEELGVIVVENASDIINDELCICGVEDEWFGDPDLPEIFSENYNLLIAHNPDFINRLPEVNDVDMLLGGHYHAGQFNIAFYKFPKFVSKYIVGKFYEKGVNMYVSSGVGGTFMRGKLGMYIRYLADPEITIINLKGRHNE